MLREIRPAFMMIVVFTVVTGLAYPLAMTGIAQAIFPWQANGSQVERRGVVVGSALIGQNFSKPQYFHPRPSATSEPDPKDSSKTIATPYAADNSAASNLGPTSKALSDRVKGEIAELHAENPGAPIPGDAVTTSGSGLDPDISPENAAFQAPRVAKARHMTTGQVNAVVAAHTHGRLFGLIGEPRVNVLALNLALDAAQKQ